MRRKTNEQFKKEVFNLVGDEYTFLDDYVNSKVKLRVKHNKCGNIYEVSPNSFLSKGNRCPYCAGIIRKTDAQFKKEVHDLVGNEYTFLDEYTNNKTKLRVKHNKCGHVYKVRPNRFLRGDRCVYCSGFKKTDVKFKKEVYDLVGNEYTFLDHYVNYHTKIRVKHNRCGHIYKVRPSDFVDGTRCPYCSGNIKKTNSQFKQEIFDLVGDEYVFLDSYVNALTKLWVKHTKCGTVYKVLPSNFLSGKRCPKCFGTHKRTNTQFAQEVYNLVGDEYTFLDSYVNTDTKIKVKHNKCGHIYGVRPTDFFSHNSRCPYCNSSKGEAIIAKILDILDINYEQQKTFEDLVDTAYLSYDFFIPSQNILIEYQGQQHYEPVDYFGGKDKFKIQQKHDKLKSDYAKNHGYTLIAVPYTEDTFSKIKKYLFKHGLNKN